MRKMMSALDCAAEKSTKESNFQVTINNYNKFNTKFVSKF